MKDRRDLRQPVFGSVELDNLDRQLWVIAYRTATGFEGELRVAVPPAVEARVSAFAPGTPMRLIVAMDHPDARTCRAAEPGTRKDAAPRDQAITRCRATFVVQDIVPVALSSGT